MYYSVALLSSYVSLCTTPPRALIKSGMTSFVLLISCSGTRTSSSLQWKDDPAESGILAFMEEGRLEGHH